MITRREFTDAEQLDAYLHGLNEQGLDPTVPLLGSNGRVYLHDPLVKHSVPEAELLEELAIAAGEKCDCADGSHGAPCWCDFAVWLRQQTKGRTT